jgi:hypothetical protein
MNAEYVVVRADFPALCGFSETGSLRKLQLLKSIIVKLKKRGGE